MRKAKPKWYRSNFAQIFVLFFAMGVIHGVLDVAWNWNKNAERAKAFAECTESAIPDFACVLMNR